MCALRCGGRKMRQRNLYQRARQLKDSATECRDSTEAPIDSERTVIPNRCGLRPPAILRFDAKGYQPTFRKIDVVDCVTFGEQYCPCPQTNLMSSSQQ